MSSLAGQCPLSDKRFSGLIGTIVVASRRNLTLSYNPTHLLFRQSAQAVAL
jgi:hypothetical protein